jgi:hypothetical protein
MSRGSWPWEAQTIVFYDVWRLLGEPEFNGFMIPGGPAYRNKRPDLRIFGSSEVTNVSRFVALGRNLSYFTRSGGSWEGQVLTDLLFRVGPPKETKDRIFGSSDGLEFDSSEFEVWRSSLRMFGSLEARKFGCSEVYVVAVRAK